MVDLIRVRCGQSKSNWPELPTVCHRKSSENCSNQEILRHCCYGHQNYTIIEMVFNLMWIFAIKAVRNQFLPNGRTPFSSYQQRSDICFGSTALEVGEECSSEFQHWTSLRIFLVQVLECENSEGP